MKTDQTGTGEMADELDTEPISLNPWSEATEPREGLGGGGVPSESGRLVDELGRVVERGECGGVRERLGHPLVRGGEKSMRGRGGVGEEMVFGKMGLVNLKLGMIGWSVR